MLDDSSSMLNATLVPQKDDFILDLFTRSVITNIGSSCDSLYKMHSQHQLNKDQFEINISP